MSFMAKLLSLRNLMITAIIAVIAGFVLWYETKSQHPLISESVLSSTPDYFITQVNSKEFDETGMLVEALKATQALHYIQQAKTLLKKPLVNRYSISGSWNAKSNEGVIDDGSRDILLTGDVVAVKHYPESPDVILNADNVHYLDSNQSLTSYGNAKLYSTQGETTAKRIISYINSEEVVMTGSVRGQYETTH